MSTLAYIDGTNLLTELAKKCQLGFRPEKDKAGAILRSSYAVGSLAIGLLRKLFVKRIVNWTRLSKGQTEFAHSFRMCRVNTHRDKIRLVLSPGETA